MQEASLRGRGRRPPGCWGGGQWSRQSAVGPSGWHTRSAVGDEWAGEKNQGPPMGSRVDDREDGSDPLKYLNQKQWPRRATTGHVPTGSRTGASQVPTYLHSGGDKAPFWVGCSDNGAAVHTLSLESPRPVLQTSPSAPPCPGLQLASFDKAPGLWEVGRTGGTSGQGLPAAEGGVWLHQAAPPALHDGYKLWSLLGQHRTHDIAVLRELCCHQPWPRAGGEKGHYQRGLVTSPRPPARHDLWKEGFGTSPGRATSRLCSALSDSRGQ